MVLGRRFLELAPQSEEIRELEADVVLVGIVVEELPPRVGGIVVALGRPVHMGEAQQGTAVGRLQFDSAAVVLQGVGLHAFVLIDGRQRVVVEGSHVRTGRRGPSVGDQQQYGEGTSRQIQGFMAQTSQGASAIGGQQQETGHGWQAIAARDEKQHHRQHIDPHKEQDEIGRRGAAFWFEQYIGYPE